MTLRLAPEFVIAFVLVFARIGTMMMLVPGLSERTTPTRIRLALAVFVSLIALPAVRPGLPTSLANLPLIINLLVIEMLIGFTFGLAARFIMSSLQTAGIIVAQQMGLAFTMMFDPARGDQGQSAAIASFLSMLGITLIFATNLHHVALMGIVDSYRNFSPGEMLPAGDAAELAIAVAKSSFSVGVQLSAPFLVFGLVFNIGLGVLSRMMPQLQVFFLAMPAAILIGTIILILILGLMMDGFLQHAARVIGDLFPARR